MSMIGLAASPGTAVEPMCSTPTTAAPTAARIRPASSSYCAGQRGSYSTIWIVTGSRPPISTPSSSSGSMAAVPRRQTRTGSVLLAGGQLRLGALVVAVLDLRVGLAAAGRVGADVLVVADRVRGL